MSGVFSPLQIPSVITDPLHGTQHLGISTAMLEFLSGTELHAMIVPTGAIFNDEI